MTVSQRLIPAAWDAEPQPFLGGLISEQAAQKVHQAWLQRVAAGAVTLLEPRLLQAGTSLLTPGIVDMSDVANVEDEERCLARCLGSGATTRSRRRLP